MDLLHLMQDIADGDREAFATLYNRFNKVVLRIALEKTQNKEDAMAIVKDVFKEVYQTIRTKGPYLGDINGWMDALTAKHARKRMISSPVEETSPPISVQEFTSEQAQSIEKKAEERIAAEEPAKKNRGQRREMFSFIGLCAFALLLVWILLGLLTTLEILPPFDLGYSWFNENIFKLF
jgi:DNA-directed RNA polymerase specialized sigma24 family protein